MSQFDKEAVELPTATYKHDSAAYRHGELANIESKLIGKIDIGNIGRTNATSKFPVLGTESSFDIGVAIYNNDTKTAVVASIVPDSAEATQASMKSVIAAARLGDNDKLEIHIVGGANACIVEGLPDFMVEPEAYKQQVKALLGVIAADHNVTLKTFDVGDKQHPEAFALDSRNGQIIAGGPLKSSWDTDAPFNRYEKAGEWTLFSHPSNPEAGHGLENNSTIANTDFCFDGTQNLYQTERSNEPRKR